MSTDVAGTGEDLWILRVDGTNGDVIWEEIIGGSHDDWGEEVIECTDGGIAVIGTKDIFGYKDGDIWIVKISSDGVVEWDQSYGGLENDFGMSLAEIPDGFALVGTSESYGSGNSDVWFIRIDDLGNVLWDQTYGGEGADTGNEIVVGQNGGLIIAGGTESWGGPDEDGFLMFIADSPHLFEEPTDVTIPIGTNFTCKLSATATFLDTWWINDTENFMIDNDGYIISKHLLPYGNGFYGLEVNINDTLDNILTSTFRISITYSPSDDTFSPLWEKSYLGPSSIETRAEDIVNCKSGGYLCVGKDYDHEGLSIFDL
jgi:hypothetical protein